MNLRMWLCEVYKVLAYVYHVKEDEIQFKKYAREFIRLSSRLSFITCYMTPDDIMLVPIFRFGLEEGIETSFITRVLIKLGAGKSNILPGLVQKFGEIKRHLSGPPAGIMGEEATGLPQFSVPYVQNAMSGYDIEPGIELQIKTLGRFQVFLHGKEIGGWRTRKSRDLLALLAHLDEPVGKERLQDELWPDALPEKGSQLLRTNLYYLRRRLDGVNDGSCLIRHKSGCYTIRENSVITDARIFEQYANAALNPANLGEGELRYLKAAARLYRGRYMEDLEDYLWIMPRQIRLKQLYIQVLMKLSEHCFSQKAYSEAEANLFKIKEIEPSYENAHSLLLRVYKELGNYSAMREEHMAFRRILEDEFGLEPSGETEELFSRLCGR